MSIPAVKTVDTSGKKRAAWGPLRSGAHGPYIGPFTSDEGQPMRLLSRVLGCLHPVKEPQYTLLMSLLTLLLAYGQAALRHGRGDTGRQSPVVVSLNS